MKKENTIRIEYGVKILLLVLWALLTIATCAGVWNYCPETAVKVFAGLLFVCNAVAIVVLWKKADKEYAEAMRNL